MQKFLQLPDKLAKYLLAAILVIVPLFPKFPLINVPGTYVSIRFEDMLLLLLSVFVVLKVAPNIKSFLKDRLTPAFLIFFGVGLVSVACGAFLTQTITFRLGILHLLRRVEYVIPFFAALVFSTRETFTKNLNFYLKLLVIVTLVAFVYGVGQRYLRFPIVITQNEEYSKGVALFWTPGSHINSTFAGHYDLAASMVMLLPMFLTLIFILKDWPSHLILLAASGSGLWLLVNSVSRTAQVSYLVSVSVAFLLIKKYRQLALVLLVSLVLIGMSSDLGVRFNRLFQVYADEGVVASTPVPVFEDRSTSIRLNVEWPRAVRAFTKNPILGTGYSSISLATDNDYLRMLGETGILGFFAFLLVFFRIAKELKKTLPLKSNFSGVNLGFMSGVYGMLVGTFLSAVFIDLFEASKFAIMFWFILGLAVFLVRNSKYVEKI